MFSGRESLEIRPFIAGISFLFARSPVIPKIITIPSLILTYFTGPVGLVVYWFFRIFFTKKISFND